MICQICHAEKLYLPYGCCSECEPVGREFKRVAPQGQERAPDPDAGFKQAWRDERLRRNAEWENLT